MGKLDLESRSQFLLQDPKGPLIKVAAEDANEETRFLAYTALGALAVLLPVSAQDQVVAELLKPLADKKAPERARLAALTAMAQVTQQSEGISRSWAGSFVDKALPLLTLAATKPAQRLQSLLAWASIGSLAKADEEALSSKLKKDQLSLIKEGVSFLNAIPTIQKAPMTELSSQAQLWRALLAGRVPGSPSVDDAAKDIPWLALPPKPFGEALPVARSTIVLLAGLYSTSPERSLNESEAEKPSQLLSLKDIIQQLQEKGTDSTLLLLAQALIAWLAELAALPKPQRQVSSAALRSILVDLCHAAAAAASLRPEIIGLLCLAAHHPLLGSRHWPQLKYWKWLRYRGPLAACFDKASSNVWATLRDLICAGRKLPRTDASGCRLAAISLASAFDGSEPALHEEAAALVRECVAALPTEQVSAEAIEDVKIYFAPEGVLWIEEGVYVAEERENKNLQKNKYLGTFEEEEVKQGPSASRLKFAPKEGDKAKESKAKDGKDSKPAKGKSKGAATAEKGAMTQAQIEVAKIQEQSETRARIRCYVDEASFAMDVMVSLSRNESSKEAFEELLPELVPSFLKLLQSPLTVLQTRRCLRSLVSLVVPRESITRRDLLPDALMVVGKHWLARSPASAGTPGKERVCEVVLDGVDSVRKLDNCSVALILPIIIRALYDGGSLLQVLCTRALHLLEHQLALGMQVSEETAHEVFDSLSVVLLALPGMAHGTQAAMAAACKHMVASTETLGRLAQMFFSDEELMRESVITALGVLPENLHVKGSFLADVNLDPTGLLGCNVEKMELVSPQAEVAPGESLTALSERAGYVPRPPLPEEDPKPGFRGGKALFIFFLCNAVPFAALMYYLREQRTQRTQMALLSLPSLPEDIAAEVLRVTRTSSVCFLLQDAEATANRVAGTLRVDPHAPEASAYVPPTEPLPLVPQLERNFLTDLVESPAVSGLGFVHFAVAKASPEGRAVAEGRRLHVTSVLFLLCL
ncbi:kdelr2 [Symbiodinium natans]|uniref:Kdelr2 protein n=1 Tax=Symbiodinium natans TaxID=878477 RepID=A0A812RQC0_9DINO|nr:kdelr2 [Symbiodinium natans]